MAKVEIAEPRLNYPAFDARSNSLAIKFSRVLGHARGQVSFDPQATDADATLELVGRISEPVARNRGPKHRVVPLCELGADIYAWVGYREKWSRLEAARPKAYRFMEAGFTIHIGRQGELKKPQVMRSEWVGRHSPTFGEGIGHPHWQMDILETVRSTPEAPVLFETGASVAREFGSAPTDKADSDLLIGLTLERMHLASAAFWWRAADTTISNSPSSVDELDRWIMGCVVYLRQEMKRCNVLGQAYSASPSIATSDRP